MGSTEARAGQEDSAAAAAAVPKTGTGVPAALADQGGPGVDPGLAAAQPDRDVTGLGKSGPKRFESIDPALMQSELGLAFPDFRTVLTSN